MHLRAMALLGASFVLAFALPSREAMAQVFLPGKLIRGHAPWESKCDTCHAKGKKGETDPALCRRCHKALDQQMRRGGGYHGKQGLKRCVKCHVDHLGRNYRPIRWPGGQKAFDHRQTGYALEGKHAKLDCRKCHTPKNIRRKSVRAFSAGRRARTFLGLKARCSNCHKDPHRGALGAGCESCHSAGAFKPVRRFADHHRTRFPLVGKHQQKPCVKCHGKKGQKVEQWKFRPLRFASCVDCHKAPHQPGRMGQGTATPIPCAKCHSERGFRISRYPKSSHKQLPLRGAHARASCRKCHGPKANKKPAGKRCISCHKDPHKNKFGANCAKCHSPHGWWKRKGTIIKVGRASDQQKARAESIGIAAQKVQAVAFHNKTRFKLDGKHIVTRCEACHGRRRRGRRRFKRVKKLKFARCADCHKDPHRGALTQKGRRCETCHETRGFELVSFSQKEHEKTRFPLVHAHQSVPCTSCHPRTKGARQRFAPRHKLCTDCHRDQHKGRFRRNKLDPPYACTTCHDQRSWHGHSFDHDKTRFKLEGGHKKAACIGCHKPDAGGVTAFRGAPRACRGCHADKHQGQFASNKPARDCGECHGAESFKIKRFDHKKRTGLALAGAHAKLDCKRCHHQVKLADGKRVRLYRLGKRGCNTCHAPYHLKMKKRALARMAPLARQAYATSTKRRRKVAHGDPELRACERCHEQGSWRVLRRKVAKFDHADTGYPLRGAHGRAACASCHGPKKKKRTRQCASCHEDTHNGRLGKDCADCHDSTSWKRSSALALHRKTRLPLTGWHALADCASCHPRNRSRAFRGVPAACVACHAEQYNAPTTHPNHRAVGFGQRCEQCHRPTGWRPASPAARQNTLVAHQRLPLRGGHAKAACVTCHQKKKPVASCSSCHGRDTRRAQYPDHRAPGFSSRCDDCHQITSWRPARLPKKHAFPLRGKHNGLACQDCHSDGTRFSAFRCAGACHQPRRELRRHRRVRGFSLTGASCVRCHPGGRR